MNFIEAIILGIIQGLTEFLPISSTGHLTVAGKLMYLISEDNPQRWTSFIAVIQLGTLLAVLAYFWRDIISIIREFLRDNWFNRVKFAEQTLHSKMGWYLIIATLPVVIAGITFRDIIEGVFTKNLFVIAASLIILALILALAEKFSRLNRKSESLNWIDALVIGLAQALALIPGSSRSGTTITAGLFLGFNRETAARFSFLLSIPAVAVSGLLQFYQATKFIDPNGFLALIISTIVSGIVGYLSIEFLLKYLKTKSMLIFIVYRIIVGVVIIVLISSGLISQ